ncbi:hypothetical protein V1499_22990 (plasmid) [Neobacillus sp. SCS-31]|uniref:hypothetical protein n=1 Tax=Neobacillus oceani TaxID=3115292 RepID=UPI003906966E
MPNIGHNGGIAKKYAEKRNQLLMESLRESQETKNCYWRQRKLESKKRQGEAYCVGLKRKIKPRNFGSGNKRTKVTTYKKAFKNGDLIGFSAYKEKKD